MPRMSKKKRLDMSLFINQKGRVEINRICRACKNGCKQSHKAQIIACRNYKSKRSN